MAAGARDDEACAGEQRAEHLRHRDVEAVRRLLHHRVGRGERERFLPPEQPVHHRAVQVERALRTAGRSRGVDRVGERAARHALGEPRTRHARERSSHLRVVEHDELLHVVRQRVAFCAARHRRRGGRILEHEGEPTARVLRVERHVRRARLHDAVHRHCRRDSLSGVNADAIATTHSLRAKESRQAIRTVGERRVRERLSPVADRFAIRIAHRRAIDGVRQQKDHPHQSPSSRAMMLR